MERTSSEESWDRMSRGSGEGVQHQRKEAEDKRCRGSGSDAGGAVRSDSLSGSSSDDLKRREKRFI